MSYTIIDNIRETVEVDIDENDRPVASAPYAECWECGATSLKNSAQNHIEWAHAHAEICPAA